MDIYTSLARKTIENYTKTGEIIDAEKENPEIKKQRAGCFVTIHLKNQELRGCIGTILPVCNNLASEIVNNAISACNDPRFEPLSKEELNNINISVDILEEPEPINSPSALNPKKYGVIVKAHDGRTGLLLPDIEGIDDADYQIAVAKQKAFIKPDEDAYLYRFQVKRHVED